MEGNRLSHPRNMVRNNNNTNSSDNIQYENMYLPNEVSRNQGISNYGNSIQGSSNYGNSILRNSNYGNSIHGSSNYGNSILGNSNYGISNQGNSNYGNSNQRHSNYGNSNYGNDNRYNFNQQIANDLFNIDHNTFSLPDSMRDIDQNIEDNNQHLYRNTQNTGRNRSQNLQSTDRNMLQNIQNTDRSMLQNIQNTDRSIVQNTDHNMLQNTDRSMLQSMQNTNRSMLQSMQNIDRSMLQNMQNTDPGMLQNMQNTDPSMLQNMQNTDRGMLQNIHSTDRSMLQNTDHSILQNTQNTDRSMLQNKDPSMLQNTDRDTLQNTPNTDRSMLQNTEPSMLQNTDRSTLQNSPNTDRSMLKNTDRSTLQNTDPSTLQNTPNTDRSMLKNTDRSILQNTDPSILQNTDRSILQNTDRSILQNTSRSTLQNTANTDRSMLQNTDQSMFYSNQYIDSNAGANMINNPSIDNYPNNSYTDNADGNDYPNRSVGSAFSRNTLNDNDRYGNDTVSSRTNQRYPSRNQTSRSTRSKNFTTNQNTLYVRDTAKRYDTGNVQIESASGFYLTPRNQSQNSIQTPQNTMISSQNPMQQSQNSMQQSQDTVQQSQGSMQQSQGSMQQSQGSMQQSQGSLQQSQDPMQQFQHVVQQSFLNSIPASKPTSSINTSVIQKSFPTSSHSNTITNTTNSTQSNTTANKTSVPTDSPSKVSTTDSTFSNLMGNFIEKSLATSKKKQNQERDDFHSYHKKNFTDTSQKTKNKGAGKQSDKEHKNRNNRTSKNHVNDMVPIDEQEPLQIESQRNHGDMMIVLSLLSDMCTAIEITESAQGIQRDPDTSMISNESISSTSANSSVNNFNNVNTSIDKADVHDDFHNHMTDDESDNEEEIERPSVPVRKTDKSKRKPAHTNVERDPMFEEPSDDESDEIDHPSVIKSNKKVKKKKTFNQRRNIRNVFTEMQLDQKTKLLREKEKERLQRLGLKQSIENTGKMLRANVSVKKPITEEKKPISSVQKEKKKSEKSEVICLDSDSDDDDSDSDKSLNLGKSRKIGGKQTILVLSSDSEDGEEGSVFDELVQAEDYYSELGLHTNDSLNVKDDSGRVLINVNHNKDDPDIFLHKTIGDNLKPHQIGGVRFLYDNLIESVSHFRPDEGNGCILAHAMGLGKTIQTVTFCDLFLRYTSARKVLVVVPVNTIQNWMNEFNRWLPAKQDNVNMSDYGPKTKVTTPKSKKVKLSTKRQEEDVTTVYNLVYDMVDYVVEESLYTDVKEVVNDLVNSVCDDKVEMDEKPPIKTDKPTKQVNCDGFREFQVFLIDAHKNQVERAKIIERWDKVGGVLLAGYEMYRSIAMYKATNKVKGRIMKAKGKKLVDENGDVLLRLKKAVCKPGPDLVVCDEGHRIRNYQSGISQALKSIKTRKRLVLTGYPLQNNLIEYWCMVDFVRPNYLGSRQEFSNMFERPIMNGQCVDSTPKDKHLMKQRAHVLYSLLQGFVQRRGHDVFNQILPNKEEHVLMIRLSPIQKALYNRLIELTRDAYNDSLNPVKTFSLCCKIWNHPDILYDAIQMSQEGKKVDIIGDEDDIALDETGRQKRKRKPPQNSSSPSGIMMGNVASIQNISSIGFDPFGTEAKDLLTDIVQWAAPIFKRFPYTPGSIENSGKFAVLKAILDTSLALGDKLLLFSQSLLTLNAVETMLAKIYKHADGSPWKKGRDYYRLDGGTNSLEREKLINNFNDDQNKETKLFILSTRAGCLGINLVSANRVVVFDVSWNPCHDAQAVCRIYRYGQKKSCHIYRLVSSNTMEKKIYYRQLSKQGISDRVVDEANLTENFSKNEIQSLVIEEWIDEPFLDFTANIFSFADPVLVHSMITAGPWITKVPFEHESLLINESSEKLSGSEKRAAKREYEQERMMAQGSHLPHRTYPLQQNFPRNTPVAPVKPFLWRPPLTSSWLQNPSSLFHHTVSHNVTVPSTQLLPSTDPLQILRNGQAYNNDHSYSGSRNSSTNSTDRTDTAGYWNSLDSQLTTLRNSLSASTNITSVLNRNRSLLHIGPHNDPLARLTQSVNRENNTTTSSADNADSNSSPQQSASTMETNTSVADTLLPSSTSSSSSTVVQSVVNSEKRRDSGASTSEQRQRGADNNTPTFQTEQSLNFDDSSDFFDSNSNENSNESAPSRESQTSRNFEVIVLDDDEDD